MPSVFSFFQNITLAKKIIGGFAVFGLLFLSVVALSYYSATNSRSIIVEITQEIRPAVLLSAKLRETVESTSAAMGFYLLDKTDEHKKSYEQGLVGLKENLLALQEMPVIKANQESMALLSVIENKLKKLTEYKKRVLLYAQNDAENFPALPYSAQNINPVSQQLLQNVSMMILSEEEEEATAERKALLKNLGDLRYAASAIMGGIRAYLAFRNPAAIEEVKLYRGQVITVLGRLNEYSDILTFEQEDGLEQFSELFKELEHNFKEMLVIHGGDDWRKDSYILRTEIAPLINDIMRDIDQLVAQQADRANVASKKMMASAMMVNKIFIGVTIAAIILITLIVFVIYQYSIKPIRATVRALESISSGKGDLTRRLDVSGNDEVGQLAKAFNLFVSRIQELIAQSANVAVSMSDGVNRLEKVSQKTSDGAITQQSETRLVSQSMGEMLNVSDDVSNSASDALASATSAKKATADGKQTLTQAMGAFTSLEGEVVNASQVIAELEASSQNIGGMLDVIKGIAEQTNLLALNAAIEAARAGEQGRGFAVVADEVRTLASRTQESTVEIEGLVTQFQTSAKGASEAMVSGKDKAREGVEFAKTVSGALDQIADSINEIANMNSQIAAQADSQKGISSGIQQNVSELTSVGEQSAQGAQEIKETADNLSSFRDELLGLMKQFKV